MQEGVVIFYLAEKGYGYLRLRGTREEFHFRAKQVISPDLKAGDLVRFRLAEGRQGYYADQVELANLA